MKTLFILILNLIVTLDNVYSLYAVQKINNFNTKEPSKELFLKMLDACDALKSAKFFLKSMEKDLDGTFQEGEMIVKMQTNPLKLYLNLIKPHPGAELLWKKFEASNKVLINPNGFPYINLKLSLNNSLLRRNSHHIVSEIGFDYFTSMTKYHIHKMGDSFFNHVHITDTLQWDNRSCYELTVEYAPFNYFDYTVKQNETLTSIAKQFHVNDYMLLKKNPHVTDYDEVKPGQVIRIPNFYNRKIVMYIDQVHFLPLVQMIYDENGLFEKYEMTKFILNPPFLKEEFDASYELYGF